MSEPTCTCPETDPVKRASLYTVARFGLEPHGVGCRRWGMPKPHPVTDLTLAPASDFEAARARWEAAEDAEEGLRARVVAAAQAATAKMAADWYCPNDPQRQRIACPYCVAEVAADAAIDAITTPVRQESGR